MALLVPPPVRKFALGSKKKLQGIAFLLVVASLLALVVLIYNKAFTPVVRVTLEADRIGNQLQEGADVKLRGVIVGDVREIKSEDGIAKMTLALHPEKVPAIPSNVQARILPKTLFGQKYVELVAPDAPARPVREGDVIARDRSTTAIETERVLDNSLPFLRTVQPEKLNAALTAMARALEGRGNLVGDNLVRLDDYLKGFNPSVEDFTENMSLLATVLDSYDQSADDFLRFLENSAATGQTIVEKQDVLADFLRGTAGFADDTTVVLTENRTRLIQLADSSRPIVETFAARAENLPLIINGLADMAPRLRQTIGTGENENWLKINLTIAPERPAYTMEDCPRYVNRAGAMYGPNCGVAARGSAASSGAATPVDLPDASSMEPVGIGTVGSPEEQALIARIVGAVTRSQSKSLDRTAGFADVMIGPLLRGMEVHVS